MARPSRQGSGRKTAANSSSLDTKSGYRLKVDPTLPSKWQAVVGVDGKKVGVVKPVGSKYSGNWDNHATTYDSAHAAVRGLEKHQKESGDSE